MNYENATYLKPKEHFDREENCSPVWSWGKRLLVCYLLLGNLVLWQYCEPKAPLETNQVQSSAWHAHALSDICLPDIFFSCGERNKETCRYFKKEACTTCACEPNVQNCDNCYKYTLNHIKYRYNISFMVIHIWLCTFTVFTFV